MEPIFENSKLIARKLTGKLNDAEKEQFNDWLNRSEQNRHLFSKLQKGENFQLWNEEISEIDLASEWNKLSGQIRKDQNKRHLPYFFKYAAAIIFPFVIAVATYWYFSEYISSKPTVVSEITPGTRNAFLVLNNGENINLTGQFDRLTEADGTVIDKKNEELNYTAHASLKSKQNLQNTLIVPRGGEYSLVLSDSTKIYVNSMSKLVYPVRFDTDRRNVRLEGEAYFEVQKDAGRPFVISVNGMEINVLGTSFNVKAYPDEINVLTTLVEGKVQINASGSTDDKWTLYPNQQAIFNKAQNNAVIHKVDARKYMQWTNGKYMFSHQSLDEIMQTLSRWYDFSYSFTDESLKSIRFGGGFNKYEKIDPILDIIAQTGKVKVSLKGKEIVFSK